MSELTEADLLTLRAALAGERPSQWPGEAREIVEALAESETFQQWLSRREAAAVADALAPVRALADEWEAEFGRQSEAWRVFGPQSMTVPFAVASIRAVLPAEGGES